jgi:hypothetical protein
MLIELTVPDKENDAVQLVGLISDFFKNILNKSTPWMCYIQYTLPIFFFNFSNICLSVAVFRNILQNIMQYITTHILRKLKKIWESVLFRNTENINNKIFDRFIVGHDFLGHSQCKGKFFSQYGFNGHQKKQNLTLISKI